MSLGRIQRTLKREFEKNPAKTGLLLALLPVAGFFIGPLLWKHVAEGTGTSPVPAASFVAAGATGPVTAVAPAIRWQEIIAWRTKHERMQPASALSLRSPFEAAVDPEKEKKELADRKQKQAQIAAALQPADLGLRLTATIVGASTRLATINGKQYRENTQIKVNGANDGAPPAVESLVLKTIAPRFVVLERQGKLFQLPLLITNNESNETNQTNEKTE